MMPVLAMLHPFTQFGWLEWSIHPSTVAGLAALGGLYLWRASHAPPGERLGGPRKISFFAGLFVIFASLNGPLHDLSDDYLFSAHMVQHLLLTLAMPPLLMAGIPGWMLRPLLKNPALAGIARKVTKPIVCYTIFNVVIAAWHIPVFYNSAMASHNIHIVEHLMFMSAAVLMWWPLMSPLPELPRLSYPGQMLYCFLMSIPMSIIAVYITMADRVLYPAYSAAPRVSPLSPMDDQMLGGLIMWVPGGLIFAVIMTVVFFRWVARGDDSTAGAQVDWKPRAA
ncbi:MAG TPA: cytochrome c oxidase assembly protein [Gemmatimonadaceae bacterium]|nr:cytochrome c oxidase assembly protein [Gemmatimonadaceae bacterium]